MPDRLKLLAAWGPCPSATCYRSAVRRRLLTVAIFLLAGAVVNVPVAWGCAVWARFPYSESTTAVPTEAERGWLERIGWRATPDTIWCIYEIKVDDLRGVGVVERAFSESRSERRPFETYDVRLHTKLHFAVLTRAGWPLHSLAGERWDVDADEAVYNPPWKAADAGPYYLQPIRTGDGRIVRPMEQWQSRSAVVVVGRGTTASRVLPLRPIRPGFAVNTLFYAALLWLPFALYTVRRLIRQRRGLCLACGYDLRHAGHEACPECGVTA